MTRIEAESLMVAALNLLANEIRAMRLQLMQLEASLRKKRKDR